MNRKTLSTEDIEMPKTKKTKIDENKDRKIEEKIENNDKEKDLVAETEKISKKRIKNNKKSEGDKKPEEWDRCMFFIEKKKRYCGFQRKTGSLYCGNHCPVDEKDEENIRIPCPIDPTHTITKASLNKHIQICQRKTENNELKSHSYYSENLNCGKIEEKEEKEIITYSQSEILSLISKINKLYDELFLVPIETNISCELPTSKEYCKKYEDIGAQHTSVLRHIEQQCSLVENINKIYNILESDNLYIEMGAGKGNLSLTLTSILPIEHINKSQFLLIDRANIRHKADTQLRKDNINFGRIRMDIKDLYLDKCPFIIEDSSTTSSTSSSNNNNIVIISKHLCGVATDLTLTCIKNSPNVKSKLKCIEIALCCHHRCIWKDYVGQNTFKEFGFDCSAFEQLTKLSSWALLDPKNPERVSDEYSLSIEQKICIGRKVKRLIDYGRMKYIKENLGMKCELKYYCDITTSPENCVLLSYK